MMKTGKSLDLLCSLVSLESVELNIIMREVSMHPQDVCCIPSAAERTKHAAIALAMATMRTMR